jgi:heptosyltransferase-2
MPPGVERLLVMAPNWLGDAVMALPAIADVRGRYAGARLVVAARRSVADLFPMSPLVDEVIALEGGGVGPGRARRRDLGALRSVRADAALILPNSFASAWLVWRAGIPERWGYSSDFRRPMLSRAVARPALRRHQSEYYRYLVRALGCGPGEVEGTFAVPEASVESARALLRDRGRREERALVTIAPGAAYGGAKRWPAEHFAALVTALVREHDAECALVGSAEDAAVTASIRAAVPEEVRRSVIDLAGATALDEAAGVMSLSSACVSNDSGAMHVAAAAGVPLAALFGPTRERESAPLPRRDGRVEVLINHVWCRPCMLRECPLDRQCMTGLSPGKVLAAIGDWLPDP